MSQTSLYTPTTGVRPQLVSSFRHIVAQVTVTAAGVASSKLLFRASAQEALPLFASPATATNFHTPVQSKNLADGTSINGAVGIPVDVIGVYLVEINTNFIAWLALDITSVGTAVFNVDIVAAGGQD